MTQSALSTDPAVTPAERQEAFHQAVATQKLKTDRARSDRPLTVLGGLLMVVGVIGAFVAYSASLSQDDLRDVGSSQTLALAFLALTVLGAAVYAAAAVARVLRVWLLRQLIDSEARSAEFQQALRATRRHDAPIGE